MCTSKASNPVSIKNVGVGVGVGAGAGVGASTTVAGMTLRC
jgi:hypothetical protein